MKDALGHGSTIHGGLAVPTHAAPIHALPTTGSPIMSDSMWRDTMPISNYTGQVQDMLGMWSGSQKPEPLTASESQAVNTAYAKRANWRAVAKGIYDHRRAAK